MSLQSLIDQQLPVPHRNMVPVSLEEQVICFADKFFSKSKTDTVKTVDSIREDLAKFGEDQFARFDAMNALLNH